MRTLDIFAAEILQTMDAHFAERSQPIDARVEALFETVRTLACLMEQDAQLSGHEGTARRIADLIAEELTWPEDKEVVDAFGEAG